MQAPQPRISGTRDYAGDDAVALQTARDAIEATLRRYAYAAIDPPILESSLPFLNRSGEDIRRQMYIFPDPGGREVCLRPELTIPVCRAYLRQLPAEGATGKWAKREARLSYFGPAFTYESASEGRYRQFYQAGAEFIGGQAREAADAEILAAALDALDATGLNETLVEIGDVEIRNAFIDQLPISERSKTRIRRITLRNQKDPRIGPPASAAANSALPNEFGELASLLAAVEPGRAELLIKEVFALADVRHVGGRTPEEIAERLINRNAQEAEPISAEHIEGVTTLLNIRAKPEAAFKAIRDHFRKFRIASIDPALERCATRLRYINAYRQKPVALQFNVGLRRGLEYYTGFLFEIFAKNLQAGHVCGGGRYDNLLEGLGAPASIPAVGFGIGLDRLLLALQQTQVPAPISARAPQALVVPAGKDGQEKAIRVSVILRQAGWSVELDSSGRDEKNALSEAVKRKIAYVAFVNADASKQDRVRIRRLNDRADQLLALSALPSYAQDESADGAAGKRP
jgi:ATP phosphoribosyltransferase regulatory subunit